MSVSPYPRLFISPFDDRSYFLVRIPIVLPITQFTIMPARSAVDDDLLFCECLPESVNTYGVDFAFLWQEVTQPPNREDR
jgi:hypothetical protein